MQHTLNAEKRTAGNKSELKKLREAGSIPAIVYGNKKTPTPIKINEREFRKEFSHISESTLITLKINNDSTRKVLIKDFIQDLVRRTINHIDFFEIEEGKSVSTHVNVVTTGTAQGVRLGGLLEHFVHEVEIECLPQDLPEVLTLDIESLDIGTALHVSDLPKLKGVTYKNPPEQVILQISTAKQMSLETQVEEIAEETTEAPESK